VGPGYDSFDWTHFNTLQYLPKTDQILLNSRNFSEFYLVDKKSGNIVKRWGNPAAYGQGTRPGWYYDGTQQVFGEHNATMLPNGHVQLFDNGSERPEGNRSRVVEVDPASGKVVWQYAANGANSFFSYRQGAAERLPNGNVLVTSTHQGHLFEVTPEGEVVWEFVNPIMFLVGLAIAIPLSIFYAGVFGPEAALFSDLFPAEVRYTGISIVYQFPGFLVAGIVPGVCTALIQWNDGDPFYICIFVLIAAATSAFSAFTIQARHNRLEALAAGTAQD
jgi:Arylsulfotransferase (ASST).